MQKMGSKLALTSWTLTAVSNHDQWTPKAVSNNENLEKRF